jgi:hypothetical protein
MKVFFLSFCAATLWLVACNNDKPKETTTITSKDGKEKVTIDMNPMTQHTEEMQKKIEELQKLTPLNLDELKTILPDEMLGAKKSDYSATTMNGAAFVHANYRMNDSTSIEANVYDCAGTSGAGIYSAQFMTFYNFQQEDERGYTKTIDFMGHKAVEHHEKDNNSYTITYLTNDRFLVTLNGRNTGRDALEKAAQSIHLK